MARPRLIKTLEVTVCRSGPNNPADEAIAATPEGEAPDFVALGEKLTVLRERLYGKRTGHGARGGCGGGV